MTETDDEERTLKMALLQADIDNKKADADLKRRQLNWESPKAIAIIVGATITATAALVGTVAGLAGYKLGSQPTQAPTIIFQPGAIQVLPAPPVKD